MNKILISVLTVSALAGCTNYYDYYKGGVTYTQDGEDCIYYIGENGRHFSSDIRNLDANKKIVYRNTRCADLYARDNFGMAPRTDRQILAPAAQYVEVPVQASSCGCNKTCGVSQAVSRRKYVLVAD